MIRGYVGLVDQSLAGYPGNVFAQITLASQQRDDLAAFEHAIVELPEVMECYEGGTRDTQRQLPWGRWLRFPALDEEWSRHPGMLPMISNRRAAMARGSAR